MRIPNRKAIQEIYQDEDGWWVILKQGYGYTVDNCSVVNGENYDQLCEEMKDVHKL